jgi:formylglycine-generating enzyme required for sulfatase activity
MLFDSDRWRIGRETLLALACVVLPASVGIAAGAARPGARGAPDGPHAPRLASPALASHRSEGDGSCVPAADESMLLVPAGIQRSFFKRQGKPVETKVPSFRLDELPVARGAFADFVRDNPAWRRSHVKRLFAEETYLSDFSSDTDAGGDTSSPVTYVSWFAARAYCACQRKRLPTLAEWERAASPEDDVRDASSRTSGGRLGFAMGGGLRASGSPRFGFVWEWTEDFDGAPVSGRTSDAAASNLFCGAGVRAADASDYGGFLRYSFRSSLRAAYTLKNLGFRCARDAR